MNPLGNPPTKDHQAWLIEKLADPKRAASYLMAAADDSPEMFVQALRDIAQAHTIPSPIGEVESAQERRKEFEQWFRHETSFSLKVEADGNYKNQTTFWAEKSYQQAASRRIADLQQRFDSLIERVNAALSMEEIAAILNDYEAENAELRKRMREK